MVYPWRPRSADDVEPVPGPPRLPSVTRTGSAEGARLPKHSPSRKMAERGGEGSGQEGAWVNPRDRLMRPGSAKHGRR